jgi:hypothetical protein
MNVKLFVNSCLSVFFLALSAQSGDELNRIESAMKWVTDSIPINPREKTNLGANERFAISCYGLEQANAFIEKIGSDDYNPSDEVIRSFLIAYVVFQNIIQDPKKTLIESTRKELAPLKSVRDHGADTPVMYNPEANPTYFSCSRSGHLITTQSDALEKAYELLVSKAKRLDEAKEEIEKQENENKRVNHIKELEHWVANATPMRKLMNENQRYPISHAGLGHTLEVISNLRNPTYQPTDEVLKSFLTAYFVAKKIGENPDLDAHKSLLPSRLADHPEYRSVADRGLATFVIYDPKLHAFSAQLSVSDSKNRRVIKLKDIIKAYKRLTTAKTAPQKCMVSPSEIDIASIDVTVPSKRSEPFLASVAGSLADDAFKDLVQFDTWRLGEFKKIYESNSPFGFDPAINPFSTQNRLDKKTYQRLSDAFATSGSKEQRLVTRAGTKILRSYTKSTLQKGISTRVNKALREDDLNDKESVEIIKKLKAVIGWQTPKWQGLCYRGALHSPLELFLMLHKGTFYIPSFLSTAIAWNGMLYNPYKEGTCNFQTQNIVVEIDTSEYPNYSTIIQPDQTDFANEEENLLSCFNIYRLSGIRLVGSDNTREKFKIVVTLKVMDPAAINRDRHAPEHQKERESIPEGLLEELKNALKTDLDRREMSPTNLKANLEKIISIYKDYSEKNSLELFPEFEQVNLETINPIPPEKIGKELNAAEVESLRFKQMLKTYGF